VKSIVIDNSNILWIATYGGGIYRYDGTEWINYDSYNSPLPDLWINSLLIDANGNLLVGTEGGGLVIYKEGGIVINVEKDDFTITDNYFLFQNYPNPFNPITKIKYSLNVSTFIRLNIYDILGREVATLVNEKQKPGNYEITWNAIAYPSGVYFCELRAGSFLSVKKMMLVK
jgi:hypothetical protein